MTSMVRILQATRLLAVAAFAVAAAGAAAAVTPSAGAPDFTLPSLDGPNLRLQEQRGRVVMINFWASWCGPCRVEMPHLARLYEKYRGSGFTVLAVNIDESPQKAASLATQLGMRFPVLLDTDKKVSRLYDLSTMPSTVLVDRDGRVRYLHRGYRDGYEETYDKQIRELLRE
jgi:thiol-disulfide isomerase/thioredoxin